jgi:hypothetical protein
MRPIALAGPVAVRGFHDPGVGGHDVAFGEDEQVTDDEVRGRHLPL